jgi:hypothetical protein
VLPTLIFILWAYGMYALISSLSGRKGSRFRPRSPWKKYGWLGLVGGVALGAGLIVVLAQSFDEHNHHLKLAGFLGTVWAEGWPDKVERRVEEPPVKGTSSGDQPVYALLHPGTPPAKLAQEKTGPKPRPALKPKPHKAAAPQAKGTKQTAQKPKKELAAAKNKSNTAKKKKAPSTPAEKNSTPG